MLGLSVALLYAIWTLIGYRNLLHLIEVFDRTRRSMIILCAQKSQRLSASTNKDYTYTEMNQIIHTDTQVVRDFFFHRSIDSVKAILSMVWCTIILYYEIGWYCTIVFFFNAIVFL